MNSDVLRFAKVRLVKSPTRAHAGDAGVDFYAPDDFEPCWLVHGEAVLIPSGIKVDVPEGWALVFHNKSGVASKLNLDVMACVVDAGYEGEVHLSLINNGQQSQWLAPGMKLIQGILLPVGLHRPVEVPEAELFAKSSARGQGGFGSTGV